MSGARVPRRTWLIGIAIGAVTWLVLSMLASMGVSSPRAAFDAEVYHLVVISEFATTWPLADVSDYLSATTPGYHWFLAGVEAMGGSGALLSVVGAGVGSLLVGLVAWWLARESGWAWAGVGALPLAASVYVVQAGTSVLPDNAGWLFVVGVLALCLRSPTGLAWSGLGVLMLGLVLTRQSHVWAVGVILMTGWLGPMGTLLPGRDRLAQKLGRTAAGFGAVVPAVAALAVFVWMWGGLVPPTFAGRGEGDHPNVSASLSLAAPAYILMLIGLYTPFFAGWWWLGLRRRAGLAAVFGAAGALAGLVLALVADSTFSIEAGRNGGYWQVIAMGPVVADRVSVVLAVLAVFGGAMAGVCAAALPAQRRWVLLVTLAGFASAQVVNANTWQRYYEPLVLVLVAAASALCLGLDESERSSGLGRVPAPTAVRVWRVIGPVLLAIGLAVLTATTLGRPV